MNISNGLREKERIDAGMPVEAKQDTTYGRFNLTPSRCHENSLSHFPGLAHHQIEIGVVVDGRADAGVIIEKFVGSYLEILFKL